MTPVFSKKLSLKRNFFMNAVLTVSSFLFPLLTFPYVSRILLPAGYGRLSFASSVISYFTMFAQARHPGLRHPGLRPGTRQFKRTVPHRRELLTLSRFTTALAYLFLGAVLLLLPRTAPGTGASWDSQPESSPNRYTYKWLYKALEQYVYITLRSLLLKTLALAATFLLIHSPQDLLLYAGISYLPPPPRTC